MTTGNFGTGQTQRTGQFPGAEGQQEGTVKEQVREVVNDVQDQAQDMLTSRKEQAVSGLGNIAQAFRQTEDQLRGQEQTAAANAINTVANQMERFSSYLSNKEVTDLLDEAEGLARRNPELFLGGAFALGLLASRFLKSSARRGLNQEHGSGYEGQQQWSPSRSNVSSYTTPTNYQDFS